MIQVMKRLKKLNGIARHADLLGPLLRWNVAAGVEHFSVLYSLPGCSTVVDIGANRGQFALAARFVFPGAYITAFEPLAEPAGKCRLVFRDDPMVKVVESAIGPSAGHAQIHIASKDDSSSLLPITRRQNELFPGTAEADVAMIAIARLSDVLDRTDITNPALLKIDVQGFELSALAGCEELLPLFAWIYVECSFVELYAGQALAGDVIKWLAGRGYRLEGIYNVSYGKDGCAIQADFLFSRQEEERVSGAA